MHKRHDFPLQVAVHQQIRNQLWYRILRALRERLDTRSPILCRTYHVHGD